VALQALVGADQRQEKVANISNNSSILSVRNLYKIFGARPERALDLLAAGKDKDAILRETGLTIGVNDVSFDAKVGEIFVVMGLSGSGKSTLVRMLNRLITPTSGEVSIDGEDVVKASPARLRQIRLDKVAMVFQHFALFPHKTVIENVAYGLKVKGVPVAERRSRAVAALDQVGLAAWADHPPGALSGGMQQRVGLARCLAVDPQILLMDEPFSALDPMIRRDMQQELLQLQREMKKTIIFITHDLNEALLLGDQIAIMKEGRFVQRGSAEEIVGSPADDYVAAFTRDVDRSRVFTIETVVDEPHALDVRSDTVATAMARMEELDRDALYVVKGRRVEGVVTYRSLAEHGVGNGGLDLGEAMIRDFPTATSDTRLHRLFKDCAEGLPVAVIDKSGDLAGVVSPDAVFEKIAAEGEEEIKPHFEQAEERETRIAGREAG
jgi:glycine betaine/proline transport system ATP-binding protein